MRGYPAQITKTFPTEELQTYVGVDGTSFNIKRLDVHDPKDHDFAQNRLQRETSVFYSDFYQKLQDSNRMVAFVAVLCLPDARTLDDELKTEGDRVGLILVDIEQFFSEDSSGVVGFPWITVLFSHRGQHIGRLLMEHAQRWCLGIGAHRVEVPVACVPTKLFCRMGYRRSLPTLYRVCTCAKDWDPATGRVVEKKRITPPEYPTTGLSPTVSPAALSPLSPCATTVPPKRLRQDDRGRKPLRRAKKESAAMSHDRSVSQRMTSQHSKDRISKEEVLTNNGNSRCLDNTVPNLPPCVTSKEISFRMACAGDKKSWCSLLLGACNYNMGGPDMIRLTLEAACRIVAVRASDSAIVGLLAVQASGWVSFIACDPTVKGKGIGSFILFLGIEWLRVRKVAVVSLTPLNRAVMAFYQKWGFQAFPAEQAGNSRKKSLAVEDIVMERAIEPDLHLLPNGRPLSNYVSNYDPAEETLTSNWYYYYYYTPKSTPKSTDRKGNAKKTATASASMRGSRETVNEETAEASLQSSKTVSRGSGFLVLNDDDSTSPSPLPAAEAAPPPPTLPRTTENATRHPPLAEVKLPFIARLSDHLREILCSAVNDWRSVMEYSRPQEMRAAADVRVTLGPAE